MDNLPVSQDVTPQRISPEGAEVANTYLKLGCDIEKTAKMLDMEKHYVQEILDTNIVKGYVYHIMSDVGIRNMEKITTKLQELLEDKLTEMKDLEMTTSKDPVDILNMLHKMEKERLNALKDRLPKDIDAPKQQNNQQINIFDAGDTSQYGRLMRTIINGG